MEIRKLVCFFALGTSLSLGIPAQSVRPKTELSVCFLLEQREGYSGGIVEVRGVVRGFPEGSWLEPRADCKYQLKTNGVTWPNMIWLAYPRNNSPSLLDHADFAVDWGATAKIEQYAREQRFDPEKDLLEETVVGLFVTYFDLEKRVNPGMPGAMRLGFGHLGTAPAQLLIQTVRAPTIIRVEEKNTDEKKKDGPPR